jgi:hypothetical protein
MLYSKTNLTFPLFFLITAFYSFGVFAEYDPNQVNQDPYAVPPGYQQEMQPAPVAPESPVKSIPQGAPLKESGTSQRNPSSQETEQAEIDFENEDAFIDSQEAIRSEHYVRRAILSTIVNTTGKFEFSRLYINHLMGFSAIYQQQNGPIRFTKYTSGMQGLSLGYVNRRGHAFELGLEVSAVSNLYGGYKYIWRPEKISAWPFLGLGIGTEISSVRLSQGPIEAENYSKFGGMKQMAFGTLGVMIPIVEVGIKAEMRATFYALDRMVLSQGLGLIIFL